MMSEPWKIALTSIVTIAGGVIVYALGHLFVALFVEPIHRLRNLIGEIADSLVFYANMYSNPGHGQKEKMDEASEVLRRQASQLGARVQTIPWYSLWSLMKLVRKKAEIEKASAELIGLSNSIHSSEHNRGTENHRKREEIEELLGIRSSRKQKLSHKLNRQIVSDGILLFLFSLLLLAVKQPSKFTFYNFEIFTYPVWFHIVYEVGGVIAIAMSLAFIIAIFWKWLADKLKILLEGQFQYIYWVIFWLVYIFGWLKGLTSIPTEGFAFLAVFWVGFIWFLIIPIFWFRIIFQLRKISRSK